jgi:hypothetical protein
MDRESYSEQELKCFYTKNLPLLLLTLQPFNLAQTPPAASRWTVASKTKPLVKLNPKLFSSFTHL